MPSTVLPMSDFKLGIVRLGRVAGKVSWIPGLPCAAGGGPAGIAKGVGKRFSGDGSLPGSGFNDYHSAVTQS